MFFFYQGTNALDKIDQMVKEEVVFAYTLSKTYFSLTVPNSYDDTESMAIKVSGIAILNIYNPPANPIDNNALQFIAKFRHVIICGDFNAHHKMWDA